MADSTRLLDLLLHWQQLREQGQAITPEELCRDHPDLLDEVKKQAEALSSLAAFMSPSAAAGENASDDSSSQAETLDQPDQVTADFPLSGSSAPAVGIPGYEVLGELGRGGMGVVYKARQLGLNRIVALKMILVGAHAGAQEVARFRTEAEAVARLKHPNIVQIHEIGEHAGLPYFSLEYCEGGSLATKLAGTPLPPLEAAKLVETLARAVDAAHQKNIIHRDLKPHNVLLAEDGTPKITDFGLAKKLDEAGQTASGAIVGTPSYMSPEQAVGNSRQVAAATDVYALGAILYELLTGRPPFKAATAVDTILQVLNNDPRPVRELNRRVPRDLETVCLKCLQKAAGNRYSSGHDLAADLGRFLAGEPILGKSVFLLIQVKNWVRRHLALMIASSVFLAFQALVWAFTPSDPMSVVLSANLNTFVTTFCTIGGVLIYVFNRASRRLRLRRALLVLSLAILLNVILPAFPNMRVLDPLSLADLATAFFVARSLDWSLGPFCMPCNQSFPGDS